MRLSDADLLDQCLTFLLAGSDSVSIALSWCLHFLSHNPEIQTRLREEILSITSPFSTSAQNSPERKVADDDVGAKLDLPSPPPSYPISNHSSPEHWAAIDGLPFLNAVIRETLRFCPPVHSTIRVATANDQIPISHPMVLQDGTMTHAEGCISIRKGSYIHIPIQGLNLSEEIWGSDATEFKYVRLSHPPLIRRDS